MDVPYSLSQSIGDSTYYMLTPPAGVPSTIALTAILDALFGVVRTIPRWDDCPDDNAASAALDASGDPTTRAQV